ncbi:site-specific integrase [Chitinibacter fontanus]|uniref:Site-specific integrase n=1 Tax=Chitinibacter fontanus TaxID=1737446 RepID=A0A7D5Z2J0_9NEIS|nr:tyrosine-type recombinase/integrase [Chitinibacter fontanus]QLI81181.1 site-specific integrase [Chitinibacter fontanus]
MNQLKLPTFHRLQAKLNELAPSNAEVICTMIQNIFGLSSDIDGLLEVLEVLGSLFSTDPWPGYPLLNQSQKDVDALLLLCELKARFPDIIIKTYSGSQIKHTVADRPLMATWQTQHKLFSKPQVQIGQFLQATLFIWRSQNPGEIPSAIIEFCAAVRRLLNKDVPSDWPESGPPDLWLSKLMYAAEHKDHPLHRCLKGMRFVLQALERVPPKLTSENIRPQYTQQNDIKQKSYFQNFGSTYQRHSPINTHNQTPRLPQSFSIYRAPIDEEDGEPSLDIWLRDDDGNVGGLGVFDQYARLREARYRTARENNYLPWDWHVLNPAELQVLIPLLLQEQRPQFQTAVTLCLITIACGVDFRDLLNARFVDEWDELPELQICTKSQEWRRRFPQFPGRYTPSIEQTAALHPHQEELTLPLPKALTIMLESSPVQATTVAKRFGFQNPETIESCMQEWLTDQRRQHPSLRATPARLRRIIFDEGIRDHGDELIASLTINSAQFAPNVGFYYYSAPVSNLTKLYCKHLDSIGLSATHSSKYSDVRIGSHLYSDAQWHADQLKSRIDEITAQRSLAFRCEYDELRHFHTQIACYTAWLLQCATGHRAAEQFSFGMPTIALDGWAILRDKVVDEAHRARLVRLSPLAREQIEAYCAHLRGLAQRLAKFNSESAEHIGRMSVLPGLQIGGCNWLFLLPTSPKQALLKLGSAEVQAFLQLKPRLPNNLSRHWFISALRERGLAGEWVSGAAGHIQTGQQPWSSSNTVSPVTISKQWDQIVDGWLKELGFEICTGIPVIHKKRTPHSKTHSNLTALPPTRASEEAHKKSTSAAKALFKKAFSQHTIEDLTNSKELQDQVFNYIARSDEVTEGQKKHLINALTRYLRRKTKMPTSGFVLNCPAEAASFHYDHLLCVERGNWLRQKLPSCLPDDPSNLSLPELLAWAHLCLIIESGLLDPSAALLAILSGGLRQFSGKVWLQWHDNHRLVRCWPGPLSTLMLLAIYARPIHEWPANRLGEKAQSAQEIIWPQASFFSALSNIMKNNFQLTQTWPADPILRTATDIKKVMQAWQQQNWSGLVSSYTRSETKAWAIPEDNLLRLLTGKRIDLGTSESDENLTKIPFLSPQQADNQNTRQAAKSLRNCILEYKEGTATGIHSAKGVIEQIKHEESNWNDQDVGQIVFLLAQYAKELLSRKKNGKKRYKQSTIINYVFGAGEPLLTSCWADNILEYDTENFEEIYRLALNYNEKPTSKKWRGKYIRYFHEYISKIYEVPPVNFAQIDPAFSGITSLVNAQIIRYQEYSDAKSLLREDFFATPEEQVLQELAIILTFRFGLRISECLRLRRCDIVFKNDLVIAYVQRSKFGAPKSRAGFRQVPCWTLADDENELLMRRLASLEAQFGANSQTPIFCSNERTDELIEQSRIKQRLLLALKLATGNNHCRIHDARHTFASTITYLANRDHSHWREEFEKWFPGGIERAQEVWLGSRTPTRRLMYALSVHLGHAQLGTTFESYTHSLDLCQASFMQQHPITIPIMRKLAGWTGLTESAIKVRRHREDTDEGFWEGLISFTIKKNNLPEIIIKFEHNRPSLLPTRSIDNQCNLSLLHKTIISLNSGLTQAEVTSHFGFSANQVEQIHKSYSKLKSETGYQGFDKETTSRYFNNNFYNDLEGKIIAFLKTYPEQGRRVLNTWRGNYEKNRSGLAIADQQEQEVWKEFLLAIGAQGTYQSIRTTDINVCTPHETLFRGPRYPSQIRERRITKFAPVILAIFHPHQDKIPASRSLAQQELHHILALTIIHNHLYQISPLPQNI